MKLANWLEHNGIKRVVFAARIGVSPQTITGWCDGVFWPNRQNAQAVFDATNGEVTPTDFLEAAE